MAEDHLCFLWMSDHLQGILDLHKVKFLAERIPGSSAQCNTTIGK